MSFDTMKRRIPSGHTGSTRCRLLWTVLLLLPLGAAGCAKKAQGKVEVPTRQVEVTSPVRKTITRIIEQPGYLKPYEEAPIYTKIAGYVESVNADIGDRVKKGDTLAKLWVPEVEQDLLVKEAKIKQAEADLEQTRETANAAKAFMEATKDKIDEAVAGVSRSQADVDRWQAEYDRGMKLQGSGVYDKQTLEETQSQLKSTQAVREEMKAKLTTSRATYQQVTAQFHKSEADIQSAVAHLAVTKAEYQQWKRWLEYAEIKAPFDGVITLRNVHTGHFLQPSASGSSIASAHPLFTMMRTDVMRLSVQVPERDAVLVKENDPVQIRLQALPGREFTDRITRFSRSLDERSRTQMVEIHMKNGGELLPGMYANVTISAAMPNTLVLPPEAVLTDGDQTYCFRVENGKVRKTLLKVGVQTATAVQVIQKLSEAPKPGEPIKWEEITEKEQIITSNPGSLVDGQVVEIKAAEAKIAVK